MRRTSEMDGLMDKTNDNQKEFEASMAWVKHESTTIVQNHQQHQMDQTANLDTFSSSYKNRKDHRCRKRAKQ
jgi:hypothetical protein